MAKPATADEQRIARDYDVAINKLCKWRQILAGWVWGSAPLDGLGVQGRRDLMDKLLVLRAEQSALTAMLIGKGVFTAAELTSANTREALAYDKMYERKFVGMRTSTEGVVIYDVDLCQQTMKDLGFPP